MGSSTHKKWFGFFFIIFLLLTLPIPRLEELIEDYVIPKLLFLYKVPLVEPLLNMYIKYQLFLPLTAIILIFGIYIYSDNIKRLLSSFSASDTPKIASGSGSFQEISMGNEDVSPMSLSQYLKNADAYKQDHIYDMSAEYYMQGGKKREAAQMFMMAERYFDAGKIYKELKSYDEAGNAYKKDGRYVFAAECYKLAGNHTMAAEMYRLGESFFLAGKLFLEVDQPERAEASFLNLQEDSEEYANGFESLGDYYSSQKDMKRAIKNYQRVIGGKNVNSNTIDLWYKLARIVEIESGFEMAEPLYEQICTANYLYKDVAKRLEENKNRNKQVVQQHVMIQQANKRYEIILEIGRGGMGVVFKAKDTVLDRVVAYKMLSARGNNPQAINWFKREAKSIASLNHQNIISIYDFGENEDGYFIVMEYVDGFNLRDICFENKNFIYSSFKRVFSQISDGLAYAHNQNIIHRDIKPLNIMINRGGIVKIMDFGLAKFVEEQNVGHSVIKGTPHFMPPEQIIGKPVDLKADIFALGVTMYYLLAGNKYPFEGGEILYHNIHTPPPPLLKKNPAISKALNDIVMRCLEKKPDDRYPNMMALKKDIDKLPNLKIP